MTDLAGASIPGSPSCPPGNRGERGIPRLCGNDASARTRQRQAYVRQLSPQRSFYRSIINPGAAGAAPAPSRCLTPGGNMAAAPPAAGGGQGAARRDPPGGNTCPAAAAASPAEPAAAPAQELRAGGGMSEDYGGAVRRLQLGSTRPPPPRRRRNSGAAAPPAAARRSCGREGAGSLRGAAISKLESQGTPAPLTEWFGWEGCLTTICAPAPRYGQRTP